MGLEETPASLDELEDDEENKEEEKSVSDGDEDDNGNLNNIVEQVLAAQELAN